MLGEESRSAATGRDRAQSRTWSWAWWLSAVAVPVVALVAAMWLGGGADQPVPFGLPDAGPVTRWGLPAVRLLSDVAAVLVVGALLTAAWLVPSQKGGLPPVGVRSARLAAIAASVWAVAAAATLALSLSDAIGLPVSQLDATSIRSYATTISQGRTLLFTVVVAAAIAVLAWRTTRTNSAGILLIYSFVGLVPPVFTGHAATASNHNLAVTTTAAHVVAVATWVGGLTALVILGRAAEGVLDHALPRFSQLALYCFLVTGVSGVLSAAVRLDWSLARLTGGGYGGLLVAKAAALAVLGGLGWLHRRRMAATLEIVGARRIFARLATVEMLVMLSTVGIAVALTRTPVA